MLDMTKPLINQNPCQPCQRVARGLKNIYSLSPEKYVQGRPPPLTWLTWLTTHLPHPPLTATPKEQK
jgi:hypothetical protein